MSRTGTEDAKQHAETGQDRLFSPRGRTVADPAWVAAIGECEHLNLNHNETRCLDCGVWAHELVSTAQLAAAPAR